MKGTEYHNVPYIYIIVHWLVVRYSMMSSYAANFASAFQKFLWSKEALFLLCYCNKWIKTFICQCRFIFFHKFLLYSIFSVVSEIITQFRRINHFRVIFLLATTQKKSKQAYSRELANGLLMESYTNLPSNRKLCHYIIPWSFRIWWMKHVEMNL